MSINQFVELRHTAERVRDNGDYDIYNSECNPMIFKKFIGNMIDSHIEPKIAWEPFAGHGGRNKNQDFAGELGFELISYDIQSDDERVLIRDSTSQYPDCAVGGVFFHPPYFGSSAQSDNLSDVSIIADWKEYVRILRKSIRLVSKVVAPDGLVYAVGRDYRVKGKRVRLDYEYVRLFESNSFSLKDVLISEPDVVLCFKKNS